MQIVDEVDFDLSWLQEKLEPEEYFARLLASGVAHRHEWIRQEIESNRELREMWREGDELWYWRYRIRGGISGTDGLVILRAGAMARVWCNGRIL